MKHDVTTTSGLSGMAGPERPTYEPPVLIDCGTVAALTRGSGPTAMTDGFGASGAGAAS